MGALETDAVALGRAAFGRVNARDYSGARAILERGLGLHPKNVMLAHVWAHMVEGEGEIAEGAASLRDLLAGADSSHGLHAHTCWHLAEMEVELGRPGEALELYERHVAPQVAQRPIMFYSAVALLWRLELMGFGRASGRALPWEALRAARQTILATPPTPGGMANPPALDHVAHGITLITTGDEAGLAALLEQQRADDPAGDAVNATLVESAILGLQAYWQGDFGAASDLIEPLVPLSGRLADSSEPLPLLEQTLAAARRAA